jgi:hypothetical protein
MSGNQCTVTLFASRFVEAIFEQNAPTAPPNTFQLVAQLNGHDGDGHVFSVTPGISCPGDCTSSYSSGTQVTLRAVNGELHQFVSWTGCTSVSGNECTVLMDRNRTVIADYRRTPQ